MRMVLVLFASLMLAAPVYANGGGEGDNTGCNGEGNPNSPCEGGGGGGGGEGGGGGGGSGGSGGAGGDSTIDIGDVTVTTGDSTSTATGGSVYIGGEEGEGSLNSNADVDVSNVAEGGSATIEGGAVVVENNITVEGSGESIPSATSQTVEGDETDITVDARTINEAVALPVNSAAPSFSAICSSGGAGTGRNFSLSLAVTNDVCQALMVADAYMALGQTEEALKWVEAAARHAKWKGGLGYFRHVITLGVM